MVILTPGDFIWIEAPEQDSQFQTPIGAEVVRVENGQVCVMDDEGREIRLNDGSTIRIMHPSSFRGVENLVDLGDLHEASVLRNLLVRFRDQNRIYTFVGSILLAVNPHKQLSIYTIDFVWSYHRRRMGELPAHIFATAENVHSQVCKHRFGQSSVIISGESGSGKTENAKLIVHYLATVSGNHSSIKDQLLEVNPIIEAFGNACTLHNDNSSRFGKYTRIFLNEDGRIKGARLTKFLLEKSRVVQQRVGERNFHIFYMLVHLSAKEKADLELQKQSDYHLISQYKSSTIESRDDRVELSVLRDSLKIMSFRADEIWQMFSVLAALLHMGNFRYKTSTKDNVEITELDDVQNVGKVCRLLQIDAARLTKALTSQSVTVGKETLRRYLSAQQALDQRDSLIKTIYSQLFEYIIEFINETLSTNLSEDECKRELNSRSIGVLDVFGFENLRENSFEQLCINYANEILQQLFVRQIFKLEQAEYEAQQIGWQHFDYIDNQPIISLLAGSRLGIFQLVDEESLLPQGSDDSLLQKMHAHHSKDSTSEYMKPSSDLIKNFGVRHYVGGFVSYSIDNFLAKNRDHFGNELRHLVGASLSKLVRKIFNCANHPLLQTCAESSKETVGQSFRRSLESLISELENTQPLFVRCLRPNDKKQPNVFDRSIVLRQLRNLSVVQTTAICNTGYTIRYDYKTFVNTYYGLVPNLNTSNVIKAAECILVVILGSDAEFKLGKTKIFLKNNDDVFLQREREKMLQFYATSIQKNFRAYAKRRQFLIMRQSALLIQTNWRAYRERRKYKQIIDGIQRLQAILRSRQLVARYQLLCQQVVQFQACCRGALLRAQLTDAKFERSPMGARETESSNLSRQTEETNSHPDLLPAINDESVWPSDVLSSLPLEASEKLERFAAIHFQDNASFNHVNKVLHQSLLEHQNAGDQISALAIWIQILRFMGTLPEPEPNPEATNASNTSIMQQLYDKIYKNCKTMSSSRSEKSLFKNKRVDSWNTFSRCSLKSSTTTLASSNNWFSNLLLSPIDRVHLIIGYGILRPSLRDEIYVQLIKQLINNTNRVSFRRGLLLFSLCLSSFQPSPGLTALVHEFISYLSAPVQESLLKRLSRCEEKGTRRQPPSYIELQTAKTGKLAFVVNVTFMDGLVKTIQADSSTTAQEVCVQLAEKVGLKDRFGFSLFIAMDTKVTSLGAGNDFVLDAISQCEQEARCAGQIERNAQWRLFYRKELFSPWNKLSTNSTASSLVYEQIIRGIHHNEYRCSEQELSVLAAQQLFVKQGGSGDVDPAELTKQILTLLPEAVITKTKDALDIEKWLQLIMNAYRKTFPPEVDSSVEQVKKDVCEFAMHRWPLLFSRFYEAYKFSGPALPQNEVIIAINSSGLFVLSRADQQVMLEASFSQIVGVVCCLSKRMGTDAITIQLLNRNEFTFQSENAEDMRQLIVFFLDGLRRRSNYLFVTHPCESTTTDQKWIKCKQGDLLRIITDASNALDDHVHVLNVDTDETGLIPKSQVLTIPCIDEPSAELLDQMRQNVGVKSGEEQEEVVEAVQQVVPVYNKCTLDLVRLPIPHTLQNFAANNFQPNSSSWDLWRFSFEPLQKPLLKQIENRLDALESYIGIMRFMGDLPLFESCHPVELSSQIFTIPIKFSLLRDEFYCQLMKQLTDNPNRASEEKGWKLMWLATGLFAPSKSVRKELIQFANTRRLPLTSECMTRLSKTVRCGQTTRKYPPHFVEVDAIFSKTTQIFHKVYLPDGTNEALEVASNSKADDLCRRLGGMLGFKSVDGFSLFVRLGDKVISIPEQEFFFDFISQVMQWSRQNESVKSLTTSPEYQVIFMRKLWINVKPGFDVVADLFHYHQEIPKYLHGFYNITRSDAAKLAALILRAQTKDNKEPPFDHFNQIVSDLIPKDLIKTLNVREWKKLILAEYERDVVKTSLEAKIRFLKSLSQWPTFGSAFFDVKQSSDPTMASRVLIAINEKGVNVYDHITKLQIAHYPFNTLINWVAGNTYFHLTIGNLAKNSRILVETTLGYKMDDLISSYIQRMLRESTNSQKSFVACVEHNG